jgi:hypothetical protein
MFVKRLAAPAAASDRNGLSSSRLGEIPAGGKTDVHAATEAIGMTVLKHAIRRQRCDRATWIIAPLLIWQAVRYPLLI